MSSVFCGRSTPQSVCSVTVATATSIVVVRSCSAIAEPSRVLLHRLALRGIAATRGVLASEIRCPLFRVPVNCARSRRGALGRSTKPNSRNRRGEVSSRRAAMAARRATSACRRRTLSISPKAEARAPVCCLPGALRRYTVPIVGDNLGSSLKSLVDGGCMSEQSFTADLCRAARKARGKQGNLTYKGREQALARFAHVVWRDGYQIHTAGQVREKHIEAWASDMAARGCSKRTIANNLTHLRTALEGIGRRPFADKMSNAALGAAGASRAGKKRPVSRDEFEPYRAAAAVVDQGVALVLELQAEFGLRAEEGVRSIDSLVDWRRALSNPMGDGFVTVIHGTKGGKTRRCPPLDRMRAAEIVGRAIAFCKDHRGKLVRKPDLKGAMERYHYVVRKVGMTGACAPHSLRYGYASEHLQRMRAAGMSKREAAAGVSTWLGHGDGRGTWVQLVYGRELLTATEV